MLGLGVDASDLNLILYQGLAGLGLSLPFGALIAMVHVGAPGRPGRPRPRHGHGTTTSQDRGKWDRDKRERGERDRRGAGPMIQGCAQHGQADAAARARDAFYAAQLRRAAQVVRLFAAAPPGGEREAAYQALVRLAAAINAALGGHPCGGVPVTPGALYRDLTQAARWRTREASAPAFDAQTGAELDRRDAARQRPT